MSHLNERLPIFVRKILANPRPLHGLARIYDRSEVEQLANKWVLWWALDNPASEWCCDQVVSVRTAHGGTDVFFKFGFPVCLESTLFYIIPES